MLGEVGAMASTTSGRTGVVGRMVKVDLPHGAPASASGMDSPGTVLRLPPGAPHLSLVIC